MASLYIQVTLSNHSTKIIFLENIVSIEENSAHGSDIVLKKLRGGSNVVLSTIQTVSGVKALIDDARKK